MIVTTSGATIFLGPTFVSCGLVRKQLLLDAIQKQNIESLPQPPQNFFGFKHYLVNLQFCIVFLFFIVIISVLLISLIIPFYMPRQSTWKLIFSARQKLLVKQLIVKHIHGNDQWADILTKPLCPIGFLYFQMQAEWLM